MRGKARIDIGWSLRRSRDASVWATVQTVRRGLRGLIDTALVPP